MTVDYDTLAEDEGGRELAEQLLEISGQLRRVHEGFGEIERTLRETGVWLKALGKAVMAMRRE